MAPENGSNPSFRSADLARERVLAREPYSYRGRLKKLRLGSAVTSRLVRTILPQRRSRLPRTAAADQGVLCSDGTPRRASEACASP